MSVINDIHNRCMKKRTYPGREEAEAKAQEIMALPWYTPRGEGEAIRPFRCEYCGGWHVGSSYLKDATVASFVKEENESGNSRDEPN